MPLLRHTPTRSYFSVKNVWHAQMCAVVTERGKFPPRNLRLSLSLQAVIYSCYAYADNDTPRVVSGLRFYSRRS